MTSIPYRGIIKKNGNTLWGYIGGKMDCRHDGCELTKKLTGKLSRIEGQVRGINKMVQEERSCEDILVQLSAITKALEGVAKDLLYHHINHCVVDSIESGEITDTLQNLKVAIEYYSKI